MKNWLNALFKVILELFVIDRQIRRILKGKLGKFFIKKYVKKVCKLEIESLQSEGKKVIWQYWEQGFSNMPAAVKACVESVEKYKDDFEHIVLDFNSIRDYVEIPSFIYDLKEKGIIKPAHFSDILRTYLLVEHGGLWVDATVFFTGSLPDYVKRSDLFVFQNDPKADLDGLCLANYFIRAKAHNVFMERMKKFLDLYWSKNKFANNYFFYLHAFSLFAKMSEDCREEFLKVPFFSFFPVQRFQEELMLKYNKDRWNDLKQMSFAHKLSYKKDVVNKNNLQNFEDTFYQKLIKGELDV